jgi:hypothetical protein
VDFAATKTYKSFQAVSYAWGPADIKQEIICNTDGSVLSITPRLHEILHRLRHYSKRTYSAAAFNLWIDAICINQQDAAERARQVPHMAKIFRRAQRVHVFLTDRLGLSNWFQSDWFSRRWVVQELLAASDILAHLPYSYRNSRQMGWDFLMEQLELPPYQSEFAKLDPETATTIEHFKVLKKSKRKWFGLISLLLKFQHTQCSDDRDRIFAYLGITNDIRPIHEKPSHQSQKHSFGARSPPMINFEPNYTLSTEETYMRFTLAALRSSQPFEILQCAGAFRMSPSHDNWKSTSNSKECHLLYDSIAVLINMPIDPNDCARPSPCSFVAPGSLPSWVADWRYTAFYMPFLDAHGFKAGMGSTAAPEPILIDGLALRLCGAKLGKVTTIYSQTPWPAQGVRAQIRESQRAEDHGLKHQRVGFTMENGMNGVAPPGTRIGDQVVLFSKARTPFILRPCFNWQGFRLVGDCLVRGIMEGQKAHMAAENETEIIIV